MDAADRLRIEAAHRIERARHPDPSTGPIAALSLWGLAWLLTAPIAVAVAAAFWNGPSEAWKEATTWAVLCAAAMPSLVAAGGAAWVAARRWSVLTGFWIAVALLPWAVTAVAAAALISVLA